MKKTFLSIFFTIFLSLNHNVLADSLKQAVEIAAYGSKFQTERLKIAAENLANENSTNVTPDGDPYRRKIIIAENRFDKRTRANLIKTKKVDFDNSEFIFKYDPHHPAANADGMVKYPNIIKEIERADAAEAHRSYEANLSVIEVTNSLINKTIEAIGR